MILDIFKDALEYSAQDWKTLVILGVIALFSFLLLPVFLITGYNYRVINTAVNGVINGRDPLPGFDDLVAMFVDGVKLVVVQIAYMIIPIAIFLVVIAISSQLSGGWAALLIVIGFLIALIAGIIAYLMLQIGVCHMIYNDGQLSKAFAFSEIKEIIDEIGWFDCILTYVGLVIITCVISTVVSTIIGLVFTAFGFSGLMLGINTSGVFLLGMLINISVAMFFVGPYLSIFNSRSIGLLYSLHL